MKIQFFYDIGCPYSWLGFQILRRKTAEWRRFGQVDVDYRPFNVRTVHPRIHSHQFEDVCNAKRAFQLNELRNIAAHYEFPLGAFERMFDANSRSRATLLFLNVLRRERPHLHLGFAEFFWRRIFVDNQSAALTNDILEVARSLGVPYSTMTNLVLRIERRDNVLDFQQTVEQLADEKATASPWIKVQTGGFNMSFSEILRLELVDEIFRDPAVVPRTDKTARISAL
ncbi:Glutathione S-transferase kappa [Aphelenchoides fujianensis]|nr:Glutathione S-transferase kappa [Aphelenchoides fujianensis]